MGTTSDPRCTIARWSEALPTARRATPGQMSPRARSDHDDKPSPRRVHEVIAPVAFSSFSYVAPFRPRPLTTSTPRPGSAEADRPEVKVPPMLTQAPQREPFQCLRTPSPLGRTASTSSVPSPSEATCCATRWPPRSVDPRRVPPWNQEWTTEPEALRVTRSVRPAADDAAEGALVEVTPVDTHPAQVAPSSVLR